MRIVTWNLWWRFGDAARRLGAIERTLLDLDADVMCLQEVDVLPSRLIADRHVLRSTDTAGEPQGLGNAIVSRWPMLRTACLALPDADSTVGPRTALMAVLGAPAGELLVACTHLDWRYDGTRTRQQQLAVIVQELAAWRADLRPVDEQGRSLPPLLVGDLNAVAESDEMRRLTGLGDPYVPGLVFTDAWAAVGEGPGFTWTRENPNSPDAQWPRRRLDHVLVGWPRPKPTGNPVSAELVGLAPTVVDEGDPLVASDHAAVLVTLDARPPFPDAR